MKTEKLRTNKGSVANKALTQALQLVKQGYSILVLKPQSKAPAFDGGVHGATTDPKALRALIGDRRDYNFGVATGKDGLFVLDVDTKVGRRSLRELERVHGSLPPTIKVLTSRGYHLYFSAGVPIKTSANRIGEKLDIRGEGGYVVAAGSIHSDGIRYRFATGCSPAEQRIANAPSWLIELAKKSPDAGAKKTDIGSRNIDLTRAAGAMRRAGLEGPAILAALQVQNQKLSPPLDESEVATIANSVAKYPVQETSGDVAETVMQLTLDREFASGRHLILAKDGRFWWFNGRFWEPVTRDWLTGRIYDAIQHMTTPKPKGISSIINQTLNLLKAKLAVKADVLRFLEPPLPVINCLNGEVWMKSDGSPQLKSHNPESYLRSCLNVSYDEDAKCPTYDAAVRRIFSKAQPSHKGLRRHWNELFGYLIHPSREIPLILILKGGGSNGKTVLMETVTRLIGNDLVSAQPIESLEGRFTMGNLLGKLMLLDDDVRAGIRLPDGPLKKISEAKMVTGEHKHGTHFNFVIRTVPVLLCNNVPSLADVSNGMRRRLMVLPFDNVFEQNSDIFSRIWRDEMPGVLNRAIEGYQRVLARGKFRVPAAINRAKDIWLAEANPLPAFIEDRCRKDLTGSCRLQDFYREYAAWAQSRGYTMVQQAASISRNVSHLGYKMKHRNTGQTILGLKLK